MTPRVDIKSVNPLDRLRHWHWHLHCRYLPYHPVYLPISAVVLPSIQRLAFRR